MNMLQNTDEQTASDEPKDQSATFKTQMNQDQNNAN